MTLGGVWGGSCPGWVQGMVLVLVGFKEILGQNCLGVTDPSWVQGMVLVPDGFSRWLWSRQEMVLVPVQGLGLVDTSGPGRG